MLAIVCTMFMWGGAHGCCSVVLKKTKNTKKHSFWHHESDLRVGFVTVEHIKSCTNLIGDVKKNGGSLILSLADTCWPKSYLILLKRKIWWWWVPQAMFFTYKQKTHVHSFNNMNLSYIIFIRLRLTREDITDDKSLQPMDRKLRI